jgi:chemotaxis protein methyltransferase CheR
MTVPITPHDVERFRVAIGRHMGLHFDDARLGFLSEVLQRRLTRLARPGDLYLRALDHDPAADEIGALARELTVTETYFFRNDDQFRALAERVLPERMQDGRPVRALSLLSAGCASGEEPYSLAIVARDAVPDLSWDIRIRAVDLNPAGLEKAECGRYSNWALRDTPPAMQRKWFRRDGADMILDETIRRAVRFEARNLAVEDPELWSPGAYDVVFCRNVLMYFEPERMRAAIGRIARALAPGGFLFLGHAETLRGVSDDFHLCHTHETFYYQRKDSLDGAARRPTPASIATERAVATIVGFDGAWVDAIRGATERVAALVPGGAERPAPVPAWDPTPALDLLRHERFAEALSQVQARPQQPEADPDVLLLEAMLLTHGGQLAAAETTCRALLAIDELNAGAHYVLALCREHYGDGPAAADHDRTAAYLDPGFAMPRLHLGLLARRTGDREAARRELTQALFLLEREDPARLLLFGGGFNREALVALCDLALRDAGGRS